MAEQLAPIPIKPMGRQENIVRLAVVTDAKEGLHPELWYFDQVRSGAAPSQAVKAPAGNHPAPLREVDHQQSGELCAEI